MSFLHRGNLWRLAMDFATCGTLVLAILIRRAWYAGHQSGHRPQTEVQPPRRQKGVPPRQQLIAATFVLGAVASNPVAAQGSSRLPPGSYTLEMRDSTAENPYRGILFRFVGGGDLIWERDDQAIQMMEWSLKGDTLTLRQSDGCILDPVGVYQVESRPEGGYSLLVLSDGCDPRALAVSSTYLRPALE